MFLRSNMTCQVFVVQSAITDSSNIIFILTGGLIPYNVTVIAVNSKGPGEPVKYILFTQEGSKYLLVISSFFVY